MAIKKPKKEKAPIEKVVLEDGSHDFRFNEPLSGLFAKEKRDRQKKDKKIKDSYLS